MPHREIVKTALYEIAQVLVVDFSALFVVTNGQLDMFVKVLVGLSAFGFTMWRWVTSIIDRRELKAKNESK